MEERQYKDIELRSEEVQEVMNKVPPVILRYGIGALLGIVLLLLVGSALFRYPDTVKTEFTLTSRNPPAYILAKEGGRLERLYVVNGQKVCEGDALAIISNVARTEDILMLRAQLKKWKVSGARIERIDKLFFRNLPQLGSVQLAYSLCLLAWNNYLQHMQESIYETKLTNAVAQLVTSINDWEINYMLLSPLNGYVAFMQLWEENHYVSVGETMFVIVPEGDSELVGKALLPMQGVDKVKIGQRTIVRLARFSEQEFGFVEGKVVSVSPVPDEKGNYVVEICFPEKFRTHYNKKLPIMTVIGGTAEIVIQERSLLERFFKH